MLSAAVVCAVKGLPQAQGKGKGQGGGNNDDATAVTAFSCPESNGFFADPEQCDLYYECVDGIGEKIEKQSPFIPLNAQPSCVLYLSRGQALSGRIAI